jgi:Spy/CpxP family protein refolding chaperone
MPMTMGIVLNAPTPVKAHLAAFSRRAPWRNATALSLKLSSCVAGRHKNERREKEKRMKVPIVLIPLLAAGTLMAQSSAPANQTPPEVQQHGKSHRIGAVERLSKRLGLTADQEKQVRAFYADARMQSKPLEATLHEERASLDRAVKADSEEQIDQITRRNADVLAKVQAIRMKTRAKVYSILTTEQKAKYDRVMLDRPWHRRAANAS